MSTDTTTGDTAPTAAPIEGDVDDRFAALRDELARQLASGKTFKTFTGPAIHAAMTSTPEWLRAGIGGAGGQGNARGVALLNSLIAQAGEANGTRVLKPETVDRVFAEHTEGVGLVLGIPLRWGIGWPVSHPASTPLIPEGRVAFWGGWGGSIVIADAERRMTFAYVMNRMSPGLIGSPRSDAYTKAVYAALDA